MGARVPLTIVVGTIRWPEIRTNLASFRVAAEPGTSVFQLRRLAVTLTSTTANYGSRLTLPALIVKTKSD